MPDEDAYPKSDSIRFTKDVGRPLPAKDALERTAAYRKDEEGRNRKRGEYTEAEYFGVHAIMAFIDRHPGCVGIRFYYGINVNDPDGPHTRRLTLVAVDERGNDLFTGGDLRGLKDAGDDETLGDGYNCPKHCPA